jgi:DNA ligase (NAD+)
MNEHSSYEQYIELCKEAKWHNHLYFEKNEPIIDDMAFDGLIEKIKRIEKIHPEWILEDSPVTHLAEKLTEGFKQCAHKRPMLSLEKAFTFEQLQRFEKRIRQEVASPLFCIEYKMDGCAVSIWYEKGQLTRALTRGDGNFGDDVTANIKASGILPEKLQGPVPDFLEMRAEVYLSFSALEKINLEREQKGLEPLANTRNAASGSLKLLDSSLTASRGLEMAIYSVQDDPLDQLADLQSSWKFIEQHRLPAIANYHFINSIDEAKMFIEKVEAQRSTLPFAIDGIVIKLCDVKQAIRLGATGQYYRWGIAYKFSPQSALTQITDIHLNVGRTGVVTPLAHLRPVFLDGSLISKCTLHNSEEIARKDIRLNDWVHIAKGGDVIPKVIEVDLTKRDPQQPVWQMPKNCPCCQTLLVQTPNEVAWRCLNDQGCAEQSLRRLIYFVAKDSFDIEGLGVRTLEQLILCGKIKNPADLFKLRPDDFLQLEGFAELSATKLVDAIHKKKSISLDRFLAALNIKNLGVNMAEQLAKTFASLQALQQASLNDLLRIDGVGPKASQAIFSSLQKGHAVEQLIDELLSVGVMPYWHAPSLNRDHSFNHQIFVLTGTLIEFTRSSASKLIKERGGSVSSSVSAKTNYLVAGSEAGSKLEKALKLGLTVLSESQFKAML